MPRSPFPKNPLYFLFSLVDESHREGPESTLAGTCCLSLVRSFDLSMCL